MKMIIYFFLICFPFFLYAKEYRPHLKDVSRGKWTLLWHDEFSNKQLFDSNWLVQNASPNHILSSRWSENVKIKGGKLFLENKKEYRGGKEWTTASIEVRQLFLYGYFECRLKYAQASGINNSFWFYQPIKDNKHAFEIDVVEAHYPNKLQNNVHDIGQNNYINVQNPSYYFLQGEINDYHIYALEWSPTTLIFYLDGKIIRKFDNKFCNSPAHLVLSTAVIDWAGKITNAIDGTFMVVDYVRVFRKD